MTSLARLSLGNRTLVIMIAVVLAGFGLFAIPSLKQQLFPSLEFPAAFTVASYPGAAPEIVEEQVTKPIERVPGYRRRHRHHLHIPRRDVAGAGGV